MRIRKNLGRATLLLSSLVCGLEVWAETPDRNLTGFERVEEAQPLWELGVGGFVGEVPDYPASAERNTIGLAVPYLVYRGDVFRLGGGGGARAVMAESDRFELDVSVAGAFAADSENNTAREGMPELDFMFELGPQLVYRLSDLSFAQGGVGRLNARLQARSVFSTDFKGINHRGYVFEPTLSYQQRGALSPETALNMELSLTYASEKVHDYFYQVAPRFATDRRAEFDAQGGYLGGELTLSASFPVLENLRGFVASSLRFHHGAANTDSPLFEERSTYGVALGFIWRLYQSDAKASW